eukprot:gnl/MRDRNA2_/MRDRNA2_281057_c0_seq1.p1 gnl/MRDRNA2_/MRDRNA2_281057_c0~~gnl/MRDRNA2_/MRDRNA2_281057_c0_seq1.p1  ORF type:complete len:102 (+),score=16.90 gnl/MRDRNA2_/MRDRNA2_281057_c0_seq1:25-330(+)
MKAAFSVCLGLVIVLLAVGVAYSCVGDNLDVAGLLPDSHDAFTACLGALAYLAYTLLKVPLNKLLEDGPPHQQPQAGLDGQHPCQTGGSPKKPGVWHWYFL